MLITQLKPEKELTEIFSKAPVFIFRCHGCKEVYFPVEQVEKFLGSSEISSLHITGDVTVDYICNREFASRYTEKYQSEIKNSRAVVVFSCGVGVQTIADVLAETGIKNFAGCDTFYINGFQGMTARQFNCNLCGECYLNFTGGICPLTSCSKSLLNGPCGGAKDGKCEVSKGMDCGWEKIYNKLVKSGKIDTETVRIRNYSK